MQILYIPGNFFQSFFSALDEAQTNDPLIWGHILYHRATLQPDFVIVQTSLHINAVWTIYLLFA